MTIGKKGELFMGLMTNRIMHSILAVAIASTAAIAAKAKPLTVWIMPNGASPQEILEKRLEIYSKKTGIPTKVEVLDWGEAWTRISQALAGQQPAPDVLQLGTTWIPYFASRKEIKPLNENLSTIQPERFVPVSWNTTHIDEDTTIYSVPWFIDIRPVLANKRILAEHGITRDSVRTYEGFKNAIRKINSKDEVLDDGAHVKGFAFPGKSDWNIPHNFAPWIWSNGGSFIKKDENGKWHANILSREILLGISSYLHFIMDTLVNPEALQTNTAQIAQQFNNGELAFIVSTSEIVMQTRFHGSMGGLSNARIGSDSIMVLPIPKGKVGSVSFIGGSNLAIPASNKRKEAFDLLLFLTEDENLDAYTKQIGFLPPSRKVLQEWAKDEDYNILVRALETGRAYMAIPEWGELEQLLVAMFSAIWEQMEIPSLYSEDKLYETFQQYTAEINKKLNYPTNSMMTAAEFKAAWNKINEEQTPVVEVAKDSTNGVVDDNMKTAPFVFAVMLILGFLFAFLRKRKK